ncbi:hypothetical protein FB451DRAFT_1364700 [Mycena latifolia]|nr:hypothetical protein FB451DRAFT_1364700 [Mycena latifolia]
MPTRQTTPSANPVVLAPTNSLKRALSEDADSDSPDPKKIKLKSDNTPQSKDKKKRKKKKKKTPVVIPLELPIANATPASSHTVLLSPTPTPSRISMTMTAAKGKRKATSAPPAPPFPAPAESGGEEEEEPKEPLQLSDAAESPSATIARLTQELSAQSTLLKKHESTLAQFNQSLTCQVCLDLLHKPYALAPCGHIACYNCLVAWFTSEPDEPHFAVGPRKKTCPHCRATVKERPVEVWSIKDMVAGLLRSGLVSGLSATPPPSLALPGPPPAAEAPPDPWHNIFRFPHQHPRFHPPPPLGGEQPSVADMGMLDMEDGGVYRCLDCMHEIWDGVCTSCHRVYPGHRAPYDDDGALDGMFEGDSDEDEEGMFWPMALGMGPMPLPLPFEGAWWDGADSDDGSGGDEDEDGDGEDSFIDDGEEDPRIVEINDDEDEHRTSSPPLRGTHGRRVPRITLLSSDDEQEEVIARPSSRRRRRASPASESDVIVVSDDDDTSRRATHSRHESDEDDGDNDDASTTASSHYIEPLEINVSPRRLSQIVRSQRMEFLRQLQGGSDAEDDEHEEDEDEDEGW